MVKPACVADGAAAGFVDFVVACTPFVGRVVVGAGFRGCVVDLVWGASAEGSVWAVGVVVGGESVELLL